MITQSKRNMARVTVTLDPVDVDLLDRLAKLEGVNRSHELRTLLAQLRPMLRATVEAFELAEQQRHQLDAAAAAASISQLQELMPEVEKIQGTYLGALAKLEGLAAAAAAADELPDPRSSNHGGHTPTPHLDLDHLPEDSEGENE